MLGCCDTPALRVDGEKALRLVGHVRDASDIGGVLVRPRDVELLQEPANGASEAMIVRMTILGRDAKIELHDSAGDEIVAVITRDRFDELDLWRGQTVWVRARRKRVFAA